MKKKLIIILSIIVVVVGAILCIVLISKKDEPKKLEPLYNKITSEYNLYTYIESYNQYIEFITEHDINQEISEEEFGDKKYLLYAANTDGCGENIQKNEMKKEDNKYKVYFDVSYGCGVCAPYYEVYLYEVDDTSLEVEAYEKTISRRECDPNVAYKPIIYIYPEEDIDLTVKLGNTNNLLYTYPKYKNEWNVRVSRDGNIYDYNTNRNYYGLYWEGIDNYKLNMSEGFVVKGEDTVKFLEDKLSILGLNDYEINEFIIYWIDKLENNKYNFISFRNINDINESMPLYFSKEPETLIRVMMDFKALDDYIEVKEQVLEKKERKGYTVVEWGGTLYK